MSQDFPINFPKLLDVLEVVAPFKHFNKLRCAWQGVSKGVAEFHDQRDNVMKEYS
jgi:hypothetical protein